MFLNLLNPNRELTALSTRGKKSREQTNQDDPFIGVSIQGATTAAQVSSGPAETPPIFQPFALRSSIDRRDGPLGDAGLIDSGAARHHSWSLSASSRGLRQAYSSDPPSQHHILFFCHTREMNMAIGFFAIVEILGSWAAIAFKPFLRAIRQESKCTHGQRIKEETLCRGNSREREHSVDGRMSGAWGIHDTADSEKKLIMMVNFALISVRQKEADIFWTTSHLFWFQWSRSSDCSITSAQLHRGPVEPPDHL